MTWPAQACFSEVTMYWEAALGTVLVCLAKFKPRSKAFVVARWQFFHASYCHSCHRTQGCQLQGCCNSSRVCQQFSGLQSPHTLRLQRFPTVGSWGAIKTAKLNAMNEILSYMKLLCLWMIFVPSMTSMAKVRVMSINMGMTDQCEYVPFLFGLVSQPDSHRDSTRRLDYEDFVAYFA